MALTENELARRTQGGIELRQQALRVQWQLKDLATSDDHSLHVAFAASVRPVPDLIERQALEEVLLAARAAVTAEDVSAHFLAALSAAASAAARQAAVAEWLGPAGNVRMTETLRAAAVAVAFGCGLELLPPFQLDIQSPSDQQRRLAALQQELAEQKAASQLKHFQHAAELLRQYQALRQQAPDLTPGQILEQITPADRGSTLQSLLLAEAREQSPRRLWAVAGPCLVKITADPPSSPRTELFPLPPTLGPLRSVQASTVDGRAALLVGARTGFYLVRPDEKCDPVAYSDPQIDSALGFNRVIYRGPGRGFWGTHGDGGLVCWDEAKTSGPAFTLGAAELFAPIKGPALAGSITSSAGLRNLQIFDESHLLFSAGSHVFIYGEEGARELTFSSPADVVALAPQAEGFLIVQEDGTISSLDRETREVAFLTRRSGRLRAAGALPWLGATRLLLASDDGLLQCIGFDDPLITEYVSPYRGLRIVAGSTGLVAAVSPDRQRLILWNSWDGARPASELYLAGLTRHRLADVTFG